MPPKNKPLFETPPLRSLFLSFTLTGLKVVVPLAAAPFVVVGLLAFLAPAALAPPVDAFPAPLGPPLPVQEWTADTGPVLSSMVAVVKRELPAKDPRQREPPCDPQLEEAINGLCWVPLDVESCPKGRAFTHKGKCYIRALRAEKLPVPPTSGGGAPDGIAGP